MQTNVTGALNVLNACRTHGVENAWCTPPPARSTAPRCYAPIDEKHPLQGQSPYSASKIGADMMAESYHRSFGLPVAIMRPFNTYGPRQSARAVIPTILSQLLSGATELKLGSLTPTRDFNYVLDTVGGFLAVGQCKEAEGRVLNVGSGREISIGDLAKLLIRASGKKAEIICEEARLRPKGSEVERLLCDASKAKAIAGWEPKYTLEQGLEDTAQWVGQNLNLFRPQDYTI